MKQTKHVVSVVYRQHKKSNRGRITNYAGLSERYTEVPFQQRQEKEHGWVFVSNSSSQPKLKELFDNFQSLTN